MVEVGAARSKGESGETFTVFLRDLTESKRHEAELRSRQELFDSLMEHTPAAVFIKDPDSRYLYVNRTDPVTNPPELTFARSDPTHFKPIYEDAATTIFQIIRALPE